SAGRGVASSRGGRIGRAAASGLLMSVVGQGVITRAARGTLSRNEVREAKELPESAHNRTISDGVYLRNVPAWRERSNSGNKALEVAARAVGMIVGAVVLDLIMEHAPSDDMHPTARSVWDIMLGVGALLVISSFARAVFTYWFNDPGKHANK